jgi:hypothetical protein
MEGETELDEYDGGADELSAAPGMAASGPELAEAASSITGGIAGTRMYGEASAAAVGAGFLAQPPVNDLATADVAPVRSPLGTCISNRGGCA